MKRPSKQHELNLMSRATQHVTFAAANSASRLPTPEAGPCCNRQYDLYRRPSKIQRVSPCCAITRPQSPSGLHKHRLLCNQKPKEVSLNTSMALLANLPETVPAPANHDAA